MKKLFKLTKVLLKNTNQLVMSKNKLLNNILLALIIICLLPIAYAISSLIVVMYEPLANLDQEGIIIAYTYGAASLMVFFFGIFYVLASFYYAKDTHLLLYMPFSPYHILGGKFMTVLVYEYVVIIFIFLPVVISYGILAGAGIVYYLMSLIVFALLPIIPLIIGGVFVMVIMAFTNLGKRKEVVTFVGSIAALFVAIGFNVLIQQFAMTNSSEEEILTTLLEGNNSMISLIARIFPGTKLASDSIVYAGSLSGISSLLIYIGVIGMAFLLFLWLGQKLYFKGLIGITESHAKRQGLSDKDWAENSTSKSLVESYIVREWRLLTRSPIYFMNCILVGFLVPAIFVGMFIFAPGADADVERLMGFLVGGEQVAEKVAVFFGIGVLFTAMNGITATGISREGSNAYVMKYLPVPLLTQVSGKIILSLLMGLLSTLLFAVGAIYLGLSPRTVGLGFLVALNGMIFISLFGMIVDLLKPKLYWDSEQQAVKQNLNTLINLAIGFGLAFGLGFIVFVLDINLWITLSIYLVFIGVINVGLFYTLKHKALINFMESEQ